LHFCLVKCMAEISIGGVMLWCSGFYLTWIIVCALGILFRSDLRHGPNTGLGSWTQCNTINHQHTIHVRYTVAHII
jgi:hypothetical protein